MIIVVAPGRHHACTPEPRQVGSASASRANFLAVVNKPPLFYILAAFGLVLGGFGALYATGSGVALLRSHDEFVSAVRATAEEGPAAPAEVVSKDDLVRLAERHAEALYARR